MIDLHLHTTASDGRSTPEQLVQRAHRAGLKTIAVTDHDTVAGVAAARDVATPLGLRVVTGIEITAVSDGLDVHVLGYFFDEADARLAEFLTAQRADRVRRVHEMLNRLADLGVSLDRERILARAGERTGKALGRPEIARALVAGGHVANIQEAFDAYLASGRPAFVSRRGSTPAEVIGILRLAGGIASLAHPGKIGLDALLAPLAAAGLAAVEVFHPDHDGALTEKYDELATLHGLARSGGSDFHGPGSGRAERLGEVILPLAMFEELERRAPRSHSQ